MPADFDFDLGSSELQVGIEYEYPGLDRDDELYVNRGADTRGIQADIRGSPYNGRCVYDGTVGLEVVSDILHPEDARGWVAEAIDFVIERQNTEPQPTGLMKTGDTAGMHIHISDLTEEQALDLHEISQTTWAKVLFCSSVAIGDESAAFPVFRGGSHCDMEYDNGRYSVVNQRAPGHYEWRLPEPMMPEHVELVMEFLTIFEQDTEEAIRYAQDRLDEADDRITSIRRAERVGIDIEDEPIVDQQQSEADYRDFFEYLQGRWALPEPYRVSINDVDVYAFESSLADDVNVSPEDFDVEFTPSDVLLAGELEPAPESLANQAHQVLRQRGSQRTRQTEATEELKKVVKKKKAK